MAADADPATLQLLDDQATGLVGKRLEPAAHRVMVVGAGVHDHVLRVVGGSVGAARVVGVEAELEHQHPGQAQSLAQPVNRGGDHPEVLSEQRQLPKLARRRIENGTARPSPPPPGASRPRAGWNRPVGDEAAEVIDPRRVEQVKRPPQPGHPPAVAAAA